MTLDKLLQNDTALYQDLAYIHRILQNGNESRRIEVSGHMATRAMSKYGIGSEQFDKLYEQVVDEENRRDQAFQERFTARNRGLYD